MLELKDLGVRITSEQEAQILFSALLPFFPKIRWNYKDKTPELRELQLNRRAYVGFTLYPQELVLCIHQFSSDPSIISLQESLARLKGQSLLPANEPTVWTPQIGDQVWINSYVFQDNQRRIGTITSIEIQSNHPLYIVQQQDGTIMGFIKAHLTPLASLTQNSSPISQSLCPRCSGDFSIPYPKPCCPVCGAPGTFIPGKEPKKPPSTLGKKFTCQHTHLQEMMSGKFKCLSRKCQATLPTIPIDYIPRLISWRNHTTTCYTSFPAETRSDEKGTCCSDHRRAQ